MGIKFACQLKSRGLSFYQWMHIAQKSTIVIEEEWKANENLVIEIFNSHYKNHLVLQIVLTSY